jgi:hypothetical protein
MPDATLTDERRSRSFEAKESRSADDLDLEALAEKLRGEADQFLKRRPPDDIEARVRF